MATARTSIPTSVSAWRPSETPVLRWAGLAGLVFGVGELIGFAIFFVAGPPPALGNATKLHSYFGSHAGLIDTSVLVFLVSLGFLLVFLAGLRSLLAGAATQREWLASLVFGLGVVSATEAFIALGLLFAATVNASGSSDPATVRTFYEASALLGGAPSAIPLVFFLTSAGIAIRSTAALPGWSVWASWVAAVIELITVPAMYGSNDTSGFYTADGLVTILSPVPLFIWAILISIAIMRKPGATAIG
jgi:hypothetical protein